MIDENDSLKLSSDPKLSLKLSIISQQNSSEEKVTVVIVKMLEIKIIRRWK